MVRRYRTVESMREIPKVTVPEGRSGPWTVKRFSVDGMPLQPRRRFVPPGTYTMLRHDQRGVVMSDTPDERRDHAAFVHRATGDVLVNGLGLGMCVAAVLAVPDVRTVTVVEADADVFALVAPHYAGDDRLTVVHADAFAYSPPPGSRFDAVWHDVWDSITTGNLPGMTRLHRKYGRRAAWQGSWARWECEELRARGR